MNVQRPVAGRGSGADRRAAPSPGPWVGSLRRGWGAVLEMGRLAPSDGLAADRTPPRHWGAGGPCRVHGARPTEVSAPTPALGPESKCV